MQSPESRETQNRPSLGDVLVATDFSPGAARAVTRAARLSIAPGSAITIVHVLPGRGDRRTEEAAQLFLAKQAIAARKIAREAGLQNVEVVTHIAYGKPFVEIIACGRDTKAYLLVVGRHGQRTFRDLSLGSTAERVIRNGATPVLVVSSRAAAPYRRPLVAVDGSETSRRAFELALQIAGAASNVSAVHAYGVPYESAVRRTKISETDLRQYGFETAREARAMADAFLAPYKAGGKTFSVVLRRGDPRRVILDIAAQHRPDLLALGTHGRSGLAHALIGSVAEAVVRAAACDVLVVRPTGVRVSLPHKGR